MMNMRMPKYDRPWIGHARTMCVGSHSTCLRTDPESNQQWKSAMDLVPAPCDWLDKCLVSLDKTISRPKIQGFLLWLLINMVLWYRLPHPPRGIVGLITRSSQHLAAPWCLLMENKREKKNFWFHISGACPTSLGQLAGDHTSNLTIPPRAAKWGFTVSQSWYVFSRSSNYIPL